MSPPNRNRPSGGTRAAAKSTGTDSHHNSGDFRHQAPTADERAVQAAIDLLREHGYGLAARCLDCKRPLTSAASLARMRGWRCAARHAASGAVAG